MSLRPALSLLSAFFLLGCNRSQSALAPQSPQAHQIFDLFLIFLVVSGVVWVAVAVVLAWGLRRQGPPRQAPLELDPRSEHRHGAIVASLALATAAIVLGLSILSYRAQGSVFARDTPAVEIKVIGHQWWWEVEYEGAAPYESFETANEIHVPVGGIVRVDVETRDVIHSFWPPALNGKIDLINGQHNQIEFTAEREGVYRGQCAEFCGEQHAHMGFEIVAETPAAFARWRARQRADAVDVGGRGAAVFQRKGCSLCHTVRGTLAGGRWGPDLTHVGGRRMIAAALLPRNVGNLAAWIADPQHFKPGAQMPKMPLSGSDLTTLAAYLDALK